MQFNRRWIKGALMLFAVLALAALVVAWQRRPLAVAVAPVTQSALQRSIIFSGRVAAPVRVELGATLTGRVAEVRVREGDRVQSGDLLVRIESDEIEAQLAQAEAGLRIAQARMKSQRELARPTSDAALVQARATLELAQRDEQRNQDLFKRGFVSQARVDETRRAVQVAASQVESARAGAQAQGERGAEFAQARLRIDEAEAALSLARNRLAQTRVRAPADGRIVSRHSDPGQIVQPGKALLVFVAQGATQLLGQADEKFLSELAVGQKAQVVVDAFAARPFSADLVSIAPGIDAQRGTVETKFRVTSPPDFLREDMTLSLQVTTAGKSEALTLPASAVLSLGGRSRIRIIVDGRVVEREVTTGVRTLERVELLSGAAAGEAVLLDPLTVQPGQRVRAARPGERPVSGSSAGSTSGSSGVSAAMGGSSGAP